MSWRVGESESRRDRERERGRAGRAGRAERERERDRESRESRESRDRVSAEVTFQKSVLSVGPLGAIQKSASPWLGQGQSS